MKTLPPCPKCGNPILINRSLPPGDFAALGCCGKLYHICPNYPGKKYIVFGRKKFAIGLPIPGVCFYCMDVYKKAKKSEKENKIKNN